VILFGQGDAGDEALTLNTSPAFFNASGGSSLWPSQVCRNMPVRGGPHPRNPLRSSRACQCPFLTHPGSWQSSMVHEWSSANGCGREAGRKHMEWRLTLPFARTMPRARRHIASPEPHLPGLQSIVAVITEQNRDW